jgi:acyl dehydratase
MPEVGRKDLKWEDLVPGKLIASQAYLMTAEDIREEAEAYEDYNPLYSDADFASKSDMGSIVAPFYVTLGEFLPGLMKADLKMGVNTVYASSIMECFKPIFVGDVITKTLAVEDTFEKRGKKFLTWRIEWVNQDGELVKRHIRTSYWVGTPQPLIRLDRQGRQVVGS